MGVGTHLRGKYLEVESREGIHRSEPDGQATWYLETLVIGADIVVDGFQLWNDLKQVEPVGGIPPAKQRAHFSNRVTCEDDVL